jgi:hypothetical protein
MAFIVHVCSAMSFRIQYNRTNWDCKNNGFHEK